MEVEAFYLLGGIMPEREYLTASEVAKLLKVARYRVYEWVRDHQIPHLRTVGRILFDAIEIEAWLRRERGERQQEQSAPQGMN